jgi:hypothetical protein
VRIIGRREGFIYQYDVQTAYGTVHVNRPGLIQWIENEDHPELAAVFREIQRIELLRRDQIWGRIGRLEGRMSAVLYKLAALLEGLNGSILDHGRHRVKLKVKYAGRCPLCRQPYAAGDTVVWSKQYGVEACLPCHHKGESAPRSRWHLTRTEPSGKIDVPVGDTTSNEQGTKE